MWVTTKSIVKEIKTSQENLEDKLNMLLEQHQKNSIEIKNNQKSLEDKLNILLSQYKKQSIETIDAIEKVLEKLKFLEERYSEVLEKNKGDLLTVINKETEMLVKSINESTDKVCENSKYTAQKSEQNLIDKMEQVEDHSIVNGAKNINVLKESIQGNLNKIEKSMPKVGSEIVSEIKQHSNEINEEIKNISCVIKELSLLSQNKSTAMSQNMEMINLATQEILKNLLSLDEGNRLVIAKLLLKDMEI